MTRTRRLATVAATVVVVAAVTFYLLRVAGGTGATAATSAASPFETVPPLLMGSVHGGTYVFHPLPSPNNDIGFVFTIPDGWDVGGAEVWPRSLGYTGPAGMSLGFLRVTAIEPDPCRWKTGENTIVHGGVDTLVTALVANGHYQVSAATDANFDGVTGKQIDVTLPAGLDLATCDDGAFFLWAAGEGHIVSAQGPQAAFHLWILDVQGRRVVIVAGDFPGTTAADRAVLQSIVDSIRVSVDH